MKLRVVAKSDRCVFAGVNDDGYVVFSLDDSIDIELGDVLSSPSLHTAGFVRVQDVTQGREFGVCIEVYSISRAGADAMLKRLNSPTKISWIER